jgi:hypothetical protein
VQEAARHFERLGYAVLACRYCEADLIAAAENRLYLEMSAWLPSQPELVDLSLGRFAAEQPSAGCHRPRCGLCHPDKRWHRNLTVSPPNGAWRRDWAEELP